MKEINISNPGGSAADAPARPRLSWLRLGVAFGIALISDLLSVVLTFSGPLQWGVDAITAVLLALLLGARWELLLGLLPEAIPVVDIMPFWVMDVGLIAWRSRRKPQGSPPAAKK